MQLDVEKALRAILAEALDVSLVRKPEALKMLMIILVLFGLYALPGLILIFWQDRLAGWRSWEFALLMLPFLVWLCVSTYGDLPKSLSNAVIEAPLCGFAASLAVVMKLIAARLRSRTGAVFCVGLLISCALVLTVYFAVPGLPE